MNTALPTFHRARAPLVALARAVADVYRASRRQFVIAVLLQLAATASVVLLVLGAKQFVGALSAPRGGGGLALSVGLLVAGIATGSGLGAWQPQQLRMLAEDGSNLMWGYFVSVTSQLDLRLMETPAVADRLDRIRDQALGRPVEVITSLFAILGSLVTTTAMVVATALIEPWVLPLLLLGAAPGLWAARRGAALEAEFVSRTNENQRFRLYLRLLLSRQESAREIRSPGAAPALTSRVADASLRHRHKLAEHVGHRVRLQWVGVAFSSAAMGAVLWLLAVRVSSGLLSVADAAAAAIAIRSASGGAQQLVMSLARLMEAAPFLRDLYDLAGSAPVPEETSPAPWSLSSGIRLEGVSYRYAGAATDALTDIDLEIPAGAVVAVVGENGSGKSTLARVIAGLYAPARGVVRWDGHEVAESEGAELRASVTMLLQDFTRFHLSAAENVNLERGGGVAARARVRDAARRAGIDEQLAALPEGYETTLGFAFSGGVDLSGGQWQRVALARAICRDVPLVVLDEPTSAMDPRSERVLLGDLRAATMGRTVLLISHRYANLHLADRIYVLAEGRVVECGSHEELLRLDGVYADLYLSQSRGYRVTS